MKAIYSTQQLVQNKEAQVILMFTDGFKKLPSVLNYMQSKLNAYKISIKLDTFDIIAL